MLRDDQQMFLFFSNSDTTNNCFYFLPNRLVGIKIASAANPYPLKCDTVPTLAERCDAGRVWPYPPCIMTDHTLYIVHDGKIDEDLYQITLPTKLILCSRRFARSFNNSAD